MTIPPSLRLMVRESSADIIAPRPSAWANPGETGDPRLRPRGDRPARRIPTAALGEGGVPGYGSRCWLRIGRTLSSRRRMRAQPCARRRTITSAKVARERVRVTVADTKCQFLDRQLPLSEQGDGSFHSRGDQVLSWRCAGAALRKTLKMPTRHTDGMCEFVDAHSAFTIGPDELERRVDAVVYVFCVTLDLSASKQLPNGIRDRRVEVFSGRCLKSHDDLRVHHVGFPAHNLAKEAHHETARYDELEQWNSGPVGGDYQVSNRVQHANGWPLCIALELSSRDL